MTPRPASTVVLVRETGQQIQTLLLKRNTKLVFEGGAWVFPCGKIEPSDYPPGSRSELAAARMAAVRETREEAGIALNPERLIHIAHWTTPMGAPRRYATWFFLCALERHAEVVVDNDEILDYCWLSPDEALSRSAAGELRLPQPTRETLLTLSAHQRLDPLCEAMTQAEIFVFPPDSRHYLPQCAG